MMESINILQLQETESELMAYVNNKIKNDQQKKEEEENNLNKLLQQKEKDLVLAAELGKALLEKNEDLNQQNEKMAEDFAKQLEFLEQEKQRLRGQLELMEDEYEQRILELQTDIDTLKAKLNDSGDSDSRLRERSNLVAQLTEQNQRLTLELSACSSRESELQNRIASLREQVTDKRITVQDHVTHLEILREEIDLVTHRKNELEKKVQNLLHERESLNSALDESNEKILYLERHARDQECQIRHNDRELSELRSTSQVLSDRLSSLSSIRGSGSFNSYNSSSVQMSLLNEMEMSTSGSDSDRSLYLRRPCSQIDEEIEDIETSEGIASSEDGNSSIDSKDSTEDDSDIITYRDNHQPKQLGEEMLSAYQQLRVLCSQLRHDNGTNDEDESSSLGRGGLNNSHRGHGGGSTLALGLLNEAVLEVKGLCLNLMNSGKPSGSSGSSSCPLCSSHGNGKRANEDMTLALKQKEAQIRKREEEIASLQSQLSVLKVELSAAEDQCQTLRNDLDSSEVSKDELVKKAWDARDAAVQRKNASEIELAKERVNCIQVNSQLLEAIQQKVELSQQLEQWQVDMEQLLEGQMRERLQYGDKRVHSSASAMSVSSECSEGGNGNTQPRTASRIFSFFQRN